ILEGRKKSAGKDVCGAGSGEALMNITFVFVLANSSNSYVTCGRAWACRVHATTTTTTTTTAYRTARAGPPCYYFHTSVGPRHGPDETLGNPRGGTAAAPGTATPTSAQGVQSLSDRRRRPTPVALSSP
ncbi:unnamed protein product, partial [Arctogadus glacialis]